MTQLQVLADLTLQIDGEVCRIHAADDVIYFEVRDRRALRSLWKTLKVVPGKTKRAQQAHETLDQIGIKLEIRLNNRFLARAGKGARSGYLSRLLGFGPLEIHLLRAMKLWLP